MTEKPDAAKALEALENIMYSEFTGPNGYVGSGIEGMAAIDTIRQALAAPGWQSIESAPKNENPILAYNGHWMGVVVWKEDDFFDERGCFIDEAGEFMLLKDFTHWMPLPPAPKGDSRE